MLGRRQARAEPRPQAVAYADDLAEAGTRRQRRAVEVIDDDLPAHRRGVLALAIAAQAGGDHLAQLVGDVAGAAFRRVAELLHLRGERAAAGGLRSEEHTSELQSLMRISYAVFCLKKKNK